MTAMDVKEISPENKFVKKCLNLFKRSLKFSFFWHDQNRKIKLIGRRIMLINTLIMIILMV